MNGTISKDKETGKWTFVFNIAKDPFTGKRRQVRKRGFSSKQEAEDAMIKLKAELLSEENINLTKITYGRFLEEWFEERKLELEEWTYTIHYTYYKNAIKPRLGHLKLQQIEPVYIQKFINDLVNKSGYSPHTVHLIFRIISASLKKAKIRKLIKENPATGTTLPKRRRKEMNVWTLDQVNYFIDEAKNIKRLTRCYIAFVIALLTGMRQGEIMALRWSGIDFENQRLYIRQTLTQSAQIKSGAKNESSIRSIHIPIRLIKELELHRQTIFNEKKYYQRDYDDHDLVVCIRKGTPMIPRNLRKEFYNLTEKLGLPKIRFHDLRHTHATMLIQQNVNVKLIADRLGHSDIETTLNTYSHVLPDMQKSVSEKLDKIIN